MEKFFSSIWKTQAQKNRNKAGFLALDDNLERFQSFTKMVLPIQEDCQIGASLWSVGFVGQDLLLPKEIFWTKCQHLNINLLQLLILKSIAIKVQNIVFSFQDRHRILPRLLILSQMPRINSWLDTQFPNYNDFETKVMSDFYNQIGVINNNPIYVFWRKLVSARIKDDLGDEILKLNSIIKKQKRNDIPPIYLHATVPLPFRSQAIENDPTGLTKIKDLNTQNGASQKSRKQMEFTESIDKNDSEAVNPVMHSFEKMETADDYDGGRRIESSDDELESHQSAIDELELNRHTSEGQVSSFYRQDSQIYRSQSKTILSAELNQNFQYNEWNEKENRYLKSFCTVFPSVPEQGMDGETYRQAVLKKYQSIILFWKLKLNSLVHQPIWKNKLQEGSEIDLDSYIRLLPEINRYSGHPRIYSDKIKAIKDLSIIILCDVSYSTDTWVQGKRVIDQIKDSISVASFVFESVFEKVSVVITSSETRKNIKYIELKKFNENWSCFFNRSSEVRPNQYTRLGPAIRHASRILKKENSSKPILILLTDGKPTDLDPYEGSYGQNDIRKALLEARAMAINLLTLTISDFDPVILKKVFDQPKAILDPSDFCREVFNFVQKIGFKKG